MLYFSWNRNFLELIITEVTKFHQTDHHHTATVLRPFFWDHPGEPLPEENFWTLLLLDLNVMTTS